MALLWLAAVISSGVYLLSVGLNGFPIRTDLLALLPREERDPIVQRANEAVGRNLGRRILLAFGDVDRERARAAARQATEGLSATGLAEPLNDAALLAVGQRLARFYFPHRGALLSAADRATLIAGGGTELATRALAQAFGFGGAVDAALIAADPFLLFPSFLSGLPTPFGRVTVDDGMLSVTDGGTIWMLVSMTLRADPFDLEVQKEVVGTTNRVVSELARTEPSVKSLRVGAVFYADHGANTAIDEIALLTVIEVVGTIFLIVAVFRSFAPLLLNLLALGVGIVAAFAGTFLIFGEVHVAALLFGTSLIGVSVDYGLHYCAVAFGVTAETGKERLAQVLPGITLGLVTTLIGYAALAVAPFPGLRQIAAFATIGLIAAFATVTLWFPFLDRIAPLRHGRLLLQMATGPWAFWTAPHLRVARTMFIIGYLAALSIGLCLYRSDDDVRRLQALSPDLLRQQSELQRLIGATTESQYLLVVAADDESALQLQEAFTPILETLVMEGALAGYQTPASFVPSAQRQSENRALVQGHLIDPLLKEHTSRLGLTEPSTRNGAQAPLTVADAAAARAPPMLPDLIVEPGVHIVALQGLARPEKVRTELSGRQGVRFVDPTADFSRLLGAYRTRAIFLTMCSIVLVAGLLTWRYGVRGAFWTILPPMLAASLVPALLSMFGEPFTFFHAMGLVLIVAIGVDYTIFCAETRPGHQPVTMLAIVLATATTLLSFGLLGLSSALAVRAFGLSMLIGVVAAYFLAPLAYRARSEGRLLSSVESRDGKRPTIQ